MARLNMQRDNSWKQFEALVARIEQAAAPLGAVVKSPDRIPDLTTGRLREVDASIRSKVGTAEVLITIECRKRTRRADDTWLEQLAAKRLKIGAAKTIAVSAAGFSKTAAVTAAHFGIELRTLSEVSATDIGSWFLSGGAVHVFRLIEDVQCFVALFDDPETPSKRGFDLPDPEAAVFYCDWIASPFPPVVLVTMLERTRPESFIEGIPLDGTSGEWKMSVTWDFGTFWLGTSQGKLPVSLTGLSAKISYPAAVCDLATGVHHVYRDPAGQEIQHTTFNTELMGSSVTFEHQSAPEGQQLARFRFKPPVAKGRLP